MRESDTLNCGGNRRLCMFLCKLKKFCLLFSLCLAGWRLAQFSKKHKGLKSTQNFQTLIFGQTLAVSRAEDNIYKRSRVICILKSVSLLTCIDTDDKFVA